MADRRCGDRGAAHIAIRGLAELERHPRPEAREKDAVLRTAEPDIVQHRGREQQVLIERHAVVTGKRVRELKRSIRVVHHRRRFAQKVAACGRRAVGERRRRNVAPRGRDVALRFSSMPPPDRSSPVREVTETLREASQEEAHPNAPSTDHAVCRLQPGGRSEMTGSIRRRLSREHFVRPSHRLSPTSCRRGLAIHPEIPRPFGASSTIRFHPASSVWSAQGPGRRSGAHVRESDPTDAHPVSRTTQRSTNVIR